jgi:hypothetical protein
MCDDDFCPFDYNDIGEIEEDDYENDEQGQIVNVDEHKPLNGICKHCKSKCGMTFTVCFKCRPKEAIYLKKPITNVNITTSQETKIEACIKCNRFVKAPFKICWTCKNETLIGSCSKCGLKCDSKYKTCFKCKEKSDLPIEGMNKCLKCGKNCKQPFTQCYTCNRK